MASTNNVTLGQPDYLPFWLVFSYSDIDDAPQQIDLVREVEGMMGPSRPETLLRTWREEDIPEELVVEARRIYDRLQQLMVQDEVDVDQLTSLLKSWESI